MFGSVRFPAATGDWDRGTGTPAKIRGVRVLIGEERKEEEGRMNPTVCLHIHYPPPIAATAAPPIPLALQRVSEVAIP